MSEGRIRHLLAFEWQRVKLLVAASWGAVLLAGLPQLQATMGSELINDDALKFFNGLGLVVLFIAGVLLVMRTSLTGRGWRETRPLRQGEVVAVQLLLLAIALVVPVLLLTVANLTLLGFSPGVVLRGTGSVAAVVMPLWLGWALFAAYARRATVVLCGLAVLGLAEFGADLFRMDGIVLPWFDVFGSETAPIRWVALGISVLLMLLLFPLAHRRGSRLRMAVAVTAILAGWWTGRLYEENRYRWVFPDDRSPPMVQLQGRFDNLVGMQGSLTLHGKVVNHDPPPGEEFLWHGMGDGVLRREGEIIAREGGNDRSSRRSERIKRGRIQDTGTLPNRLALMQSLDPGKTFLQPSSTRGFEIDPSGPHGHRNTFWTPLREMEGVGRDTGPASYVGTLLCSSLRYRLLADLAPGMSGTFRDDAAVVQVRVTADWQNPHGEAPYTVRLTLPATSEEAWEPPNLNPLRRWSFVFHYPEFGVYVEARQNRTSARRGVGGSRHWSVGLYQKISVVRLNSALKGQTPRLLVFRPEVRRIGRFRVESETIRSSDSRNMTPETLAYQRLIRNPNGPESFDPLLDLRPNPATATAREIGAWLRESIQAFPYPTGPAEFAGNHGPLLLRTGEHSSRAWVYVMAFGLGAPEADRGELIARLGSLRRAPRIVVQRGWAKECREELNRALATENPEEDLLRLGAFLGTEHAVDRILEEIATGTSSSIYEAARQIPGIDARLDVAVAASMGAANDAFRKAMAENRSSSLKLNYWNVPLAHGHPNAVVSLIAAVREAKRRDFRVYGDRPEGLFVLPKGRGGYSALADMEADEFRWDPVRRKWIHQDREETQ